MPLRLLTLILLLALLAVPASAQDDWQGLLRRFLTTEDLDEAYSQDVMEMLEDRAQNPIDLNRATPGELEQLPFLTPQAVDALTAYLQRYRPVRSLSELRMVKELDDDTRELLACFVCCRHEEPSASVPPETLRRLLSDGSHRLTAAARVPLYDRRGDANGYLGHKVRHDLRYRYTCGQRLTFGLTAAQDAGEPFLARGNTLGYDHYALYFQLRGQGRLEQLNLGTYRVQMGMGLVMNTGFYLGKLVALQSLQRSGTMLAAHASRSAASYLQGAAATVRLARRWQATAFASFRYVDATLNDDGTVRTLTTDGYHRTPAEMDKKHNTGRTDLGASLGWRQGAAHLSLNGLYTRFSRQLAPPDVLYRRYAAAGNDFLNVSLDYGYNNHRWTLSGETAMNRRGALAAIHSVSLKAADGLTLTLLHRYYDRRYTALHARSFAEGSSVQNEHGAYLAATWRASRTWTLHAYLDYAHFPSPRYLVSAPSDAVDGVMAVSYTRKRWTLDGRYRLHVRQQDDDDGRRLVNKVEHRLRLALGCLPHGAVRLRTQADAVAVSGKDGRKLGLMVSQHADWHYRWLKADAHLGWFRTDGYDARIYQYEPSLRYDFSFPMYQGRGMRYALMLAADVARRLTAQARLGVTKYTDRSVVGSGLQQVDGATLTDISLQLSYTF